MQNNIVGTMRQFKITDYGSSFHHAGSSGTGGGSIGEKFLERIHDHLRVNSIRSRSSHQISNLQADNSILAQGLAIYGLPQKDLIEPQIQPYLNSVDFIDSLADVYRRLESCPESEKSKVYVEQCALLRGLHDPQLCKRSLRLEGSMLLMFILRLFFLQH